MSKSPMNEIRETTLVLAENDMLVKHRRAYKNLTNKYIKGETFSTTLPILNAQAKDKIGDLKTEIKREGKLTIINYNYRLPKKPREICAAELSLLIKDSFIRQIGGLRIVDWPKEDLSDIHFLHSYPFFVSAIGEMKNGEITPLSGFKSIISHAQKGKSIRIEYMPKTRPVPLVVWKDTYKIINNSNEESKNIEIKFLVPRNDTKQKVKIETNTLISLEQDDDGNAWAKVELSHLKSDEEYICDFQYIIRKESYPFSNQYGNIQFLKNLAEPDSVGYPFLKETKLWPINDPRIQKIKNRILDGQKEIFDIIHLIFEFVNQSFEYENNEKRLPANEILNTRKGDCSEFSDLFVTLARACGIPARVCTGYFWHLRGSLEGHAWCEIFTRQGWIPLDPLHGFLHGVSFQHILFSKESNDVDYPAYLIKSTGGNVIAEREYKISYK